MLLKEMNSLILSFLFQLIMQPFILPFILKLHSVEFVISYSSTHETHLENPVLLLAFILAS